MDRQKKTPKHPSLPVPGWLFVACMAIYLELLLHFWTEDSILWGRLAAVTLFAGAFGALTGFLSSLLPRKGEKWGSAILALLLTLVYMVEYFLRDGFFTFMPLTSILSTGGNVMTDFTSVILSLILRDFWRIALVLAPTVLYLILPKAPARPHRFATSGILALVSLVLYLAGFGVVKLVGTDAAKLDENYNFDNAVHAFGLNVSLVLDASHTGGETPEDPDFFTPVEIPTVPDRTEPTTTPTTETTPESPTEETQPPVVYGENALDIDFSALAESESNASVVAVHSYVASLTPSSQNEYTGLFEGKNLILITAESFSAEVIDPELTPTLYRLATQGIQFTDYHQPLWGGSTITGEFSVLTGLVAANGTDSILIGNHQNMFLTMGHQLQKLGYTSYAFHNHTYTYYNRNRSHAALGYDQFIGMGNGMEAGITKQWPESDQEMMEYTVDMYIDQQPFSIYYMTVSGHALYNNLGGNAMCSKNYAATAGLDCSETVKCYLAGQLELENALTSLLTRLEEAGILNDTVIVLSTDHYPYGLEKSTTWNNAQDYLSELYGYKYSNVAQRDHSALIIWSGCIEGMNLVVDTPTYSLDILPTLSNLFGVDYDSRLLVGRDVFSDEIPLALWPDYTWKTEMGFYDGSTGTFTPAEGVEVDEEYVASVRTIVANKINFSRMVQSLNYYNYLTPYLPN